MLVRSFQRLRTRIRNLMLCGGLLTLQVETQKIGGSSESEYFLALRRSVRQSSVYATPSSNSSHTTVSQRKYLNALGSEGPNRNKSYSRKDEIFKGIEAQRAKEKEAAAKANASSKR